eukprot:m.971680 g.971680  ORF g.971680 m.971680 type:complete len:82 (-) comp23927_c0_seq20:3988-4233(-)
MYRLTSGTTECKPARICSISNATDPLSLNHDTRSTYAATLATVTGVAAEHVVLNGIVVVASCARATKTVNRRETSTPTLSP